MMPDEDKALIRALTYLTEKFPGVALLYPHNSSDQALGIDLVGASWRSFPLFRQANSLLYPTGYVLQVPTPPYEDDASEWTIFFSKRYGGTPLNRLHRYLCALEECYPREFYHLEDHLPVFEKLLSSSLVWRICKGRFNHDEEGFNVSVGWGNGYVGLPPGHPWYGKHWNDLNDVLVHGGVTYAERKYPDLLSDDSSSIGLHWVGFDTGHWGDTLDKWPESKVKREAQSLYLQAAWAWAGIKNPVSP